MGSYRLLGLCQIGEYGRNPLGPANCSARGKPRLPGSVGERRRVANPARLSARSARFPSSHRRAASQMFAARAHRGGSIAVADLTKSNYRLPPTELPRHSPMGSDAIRTECEVVHASRLELPQRRRADHRRVVRGQRQGRDEDRQPRGLAPDRRLRAEPAIGRHSACDADRRGVRTIAPPRTCDPAGPRRPTRWKLAQRSAISCGLKTSDGGGAASPESGCQPDFCWRSRT